VAKIDNVTLDSVRDFGVQMAQNAASAMAIYGPVANAPELSSLKARLMS
jgi:hypothetical protein